MNVEKSFLKAISDFSLIQKDDVVIVGFSGGSDSVVLTYLLIKFRNYLQIKDIVLAHVNYQLRGEESDRDEEFVTKFSKDHNLKLEVLKIDLKEFAKKEKKSIEQAAREIRYDFFRKVKAKYEGTKIATGHHLTDLAETMILWFIQGNRNGIKGFKAKDKDIIRPLYYMRKEDIQSYTKEKNLSYVVDSSNYVPVYLRNKIRISVFQKLKLINPSLEKSLLNLSIILQIDDEFIQQESYKYIELFKQKEFIDLDVIPHKALLIRVIQEWIYNKTGVYPSYTFIFEVLKLIKSTYGKLQIKKNIFLEKEKNILFIKTVDNNENMGFEYKFRIGEEVFVKETGMKIKSYTVTNIDMNKLNNEKRMVCFDIPDFSEKEEFIIRNRKKGDRFLPFGRGSEKKLKDVMIDLKIPKNMRDSIPLLVFRNKILWIVGYKRSGYFPVNSTSSKLVCFELKEV